MQLAHKQEQDLLERETAVAALEVRHRVLVAKQFVDAGEKGWMKRMIFCVVFG